MKAIIKNGAANKDIQNCFISEFGTEITFHNSDMNVFKFDIMLNGRFVCTLRYKYCALFPIDFEDLKKFILSKRPSLKGKDYRIAV